MAVALHALTMSQPKNIDEARLVELVQRRDSAAMRELYDRHIRYLTAVGGRYVDDDTLRDVLQESFVKIFSSISWFEYRGEGSLRAWMTRIVVNVALSHLRGAISSSSIDSIELPAEEEPDVGHVPIEVIHRMIRSLPTGYRTVFNLYVFEQRSHREIAALLGIGENSSASQLHRAKAILAKQINEYKSKQDKTYEQPME